MKVDTSREIARSHKNYFLVVAFLSYCLLVTLRARLRRHAGGLTPRSVLEQLKAIQMLDVKTPTTDGRCLTLTRYTQPDAAQQLILARLGLTIPPQPPPKITTLPSGNEADVVKTWATEPRISLVRIPAHRDHRFRPNVITRSGDRDHGFRAS